MGVGRLEDFHFDSDFCENKLILALMKKKILPQFPYISNET